MKEARGDLWEYEADVRCITTNGSVKKNGEAVMGRGCAKEAADKWLDLPGLLADGINREGNHVLWLFSTKSAFSFWHLFSFPVKHHWREKADLALIKRSAGELANLIQTDQSCVLPRPGCGNGQLDWDNVKPVIEPILDDRFTVITFA